MTKYRSSYPILSRKRPREIVLLEVLQSIFNSGSEGLLLLHIQYATEMTSTIILRECLELLEQSGNLTRTHNDWRQLDPRSFYYKLTPKGYQLYHTLTEYLGLIGLGTEATRATAAKPTIEIQ
jgi:predicted transcriptional regulator